MIHTTRKWFRSRRRQIIVTRLSYPRFWSIVDAILVVIFIAIVLRRYR